MILDVKNVRSGLSSRANERILRNCEDRTGLLPCEILGELFEKGSSYRTGFGQFTRKLAESGDDGMLHFGFIQLVPCLRPW